MSSQVEVKAVEQTQQPVKQENQNTTNQENNKQVEESTQDKNWKEFRTARDAERKQAEEAAKQAKKSQEEAAALRAALDAVLSKPNHNQRQDSDNEHSEETEDQRIDKRVNEALAKREAENEKKRREIEAQEYPQRLARNYKDFDQVCSPDNLDYLDYHYPEVAQAFAHMPQGYEKWDSIYKAVKRFIPNTESKKEQSKAEKNFNKPQSASSPGMSQGGDLAPAYRLDEKRKEENWKRMRQKMNQLS